MNCTCNKSKLIVSDEGKHLGEYHLSNCEVDGELHVRIFEKNVVGMEKFVRRNEDVSC